MLREKVKHPKEAEKSMLTAHSGEYMLLLFMCLFSVTFLVATFLFVTTGDDMIFVHDMQMPFFSSSFR
ncbi:MAG: hypothetical protein WBM35_01165 [Candidatus Electrothrix sp.]